MVQALCEVVGMCGCRSRAQSQNGVHLDHVSLTWCTHINNPFNRRVCTFLTLWVRWAVGTACTLYFCLPNRVGAETTVSTWTWGSSYSLSELGAVELFHLMLESQVRSCLRSQKVEDWVFVTLHCKPTKVELGLKRKHVYNFNNNCKDKIKFLWSCSSPVFHQQPFFYLTEKIP